MGERESQLERETVDVDTDLDSVIKTDREQESKSGGAVRSRIGSLASTRSLLVAFILSVAGTIVFGLIPFLGIVGKLLGVAAGGFLYGLGSEGRRYFEMALAGAVAGGGVALLGNLVVAVVASGTTLVAVGVVGGALAGLLGHYFGRDLRDGLTRDIGTQ